MKALEDFILAHPSLMHTNLFRYPAVIGFLACACVTLWLVFSKGKLEKEAPWSSADGISFRLSLLVMACFCVLCAYEEWEFPGRRDFSNPTLAYILSFLWFSLLGIAIFFKLKESKQNGWPEYKAAYPTLKTKRDFIIHFFGVFFLMPFFCIGILASGLFVMWLTGAKMSEQTTFWEAVMMVGLMPFGVLGGALVGNIAWMMVLSRFASADEMKTWADYDTTYIPLFTPAFKAINEFFIQRKMQNQAISE